MSYVQLFQCDGCERQITVEQALGKGWMQLFEIVDEETMARRTAIIAEGGLSDSKSGIFCSLHCLAQWAEHGAQLEDMERGFG